MRFKKILLMPTLLVVCLAMTNAVTATDEAALIIIPNLGKDNSHYVVSAPGETFTVNITITDAVDLWGWSCVVSWNPSIANCTKKQLGPFNPVGTSLLGVIDNVNGRIPKLAAGTTEEDTVTGDGVLAILTFTGRAAGEVDLNVSEADYINYPSMDVFSLTAQQAEIIVLPEISASLIIPLFLIATAAIALLTKRDRSRRP